jgi:hypothetical protein
MKRLPTAFNLTAGRSIFFCPEGASSPLPIASRGGFSQEPHRYPTGTLLTGVIQWSKAKKKRSCRHKPPHTFLAPQLNFVLKSLSVRTLPAKYPGGGTGMPGTHTTHFQSRRISPNRGPRRALLLAGVETDTAAEAKCLGQENFCSATFPPRKPRPSKTVPPSRQPSPGCDCPGVSRMGYAFDL